MRCRCEFLRKVEDAEMAQELESAQQGGRFTLVRFLVSLPLVIASSLLMGGWLEKCHYRISSGGDCYDRAS